MKFLLIYFLSFNIFSIEFEIIGPCSEKPVFIHQLPAKQQQSVGDLTIKILEEFAIPYQGNPRGINSILNSPTGDGAIEILSDSELRAYGWCYSVNGHGPEVYPDEFMVQKNDQVVWWFGFAHFKNNEWITQCTPAYTVKPQHLCP